MKDAVTEKHHTRGCKHVLKIHGGQDEVWMPENYVFWVSHLDTAKFAGACLVHSVLGKDTATESCALGLLLPFPVPPCWPPTTSTRPADCMLAWNVQTHPFKAISPGRAGARHRGRGPARLWKPGGCSWPSGQVILFGGRPGPFCLGAVFSIVSNCCHSLWHIGT